MSEPRPSLGELRAAGVELRVACFSGDLDALLSRTRRGRLALRISRWSVRRTARR